MTYSDRDSFGFLSYISKEELDSILGSVLSSPYSKRPLKQELNSLKKSTIFFKLISQILYETGITIKKAISLKPCDIEKNAIIVDKSKKNKPSIKPISDELYRDLLEFIFLNRIEYTSFIFSKDKVVDNSKNILATKPISIKRYEQLFYEYFKESPQILKDSCIINHLNKNSLNLNQNKKISRLSDSNITTVDIDGKNVKIYTLNKKIKLLESIKTKLTKINLPDERTSQVIEFLLAGKSVDELILDLSKKGQQLSRRRIEQILESLDITSNDIKKYLVLDKLKLDLEKLISNDKSERFGKFAKQQLDEQTIFVRHSGSLEVFRW
jgi:site-specific recombinase XerD